MTQYDSVGSLYLNVCELLFKQTELAIVERVIRPLLRPDDKIVEFACGTGFYTKRLLSWTASPLTAMDISPVMLGIASQSLSREVASGRVRFTLGDGASKTSYAPDQSIGFFDRAFASWFLNYARSRSELVAMFATVALNLADDGVLAAVMPHPTEDLAARKSAYSQCPLDRTWPRLDYVQELGDGSGWTSRVHLENMSLETTHMKKSVYEAAAREGGFRGKLEWRGEGLEETGFGEKWIQQFNLTAEEYRIQKENPMLGLLMVWKS
ncbi:uncharacterized protein MAM_08145 [Metarhizium album ARSEF 1941]|uniref:Methyltransferase domain-containing protein n=1 Tax=Metarhizium album (strain ARSEF 1941) TaxID=1081103 RepID=A0A0B2WDR1_METAS|nr:uncharacterized protein MAM_08145 [Metarhizium album ARSEF 1941]KHN94016.1 hypothetical protein MAM_08145 [Metarhizium album ARSEF 1941]